VKDLLYGLAMLGAAALGLGGIWMWRRDRKRAILLIAAAVVTLVNVLSWSTLSTPQDAGGRGVAPPPAG
jgi:hypothetical protein